MFYTLTDSDFPRATGIEAESNVFGAFLTDWSSEGPSVELVEFLEGVRDESLERVELDEIRSDGLHNMGGSHLYFIGKNVRFEWEYTGCVTKEYSLDSVIEIAQAWNDFTNRRDRQNVMWRGGRFYLKQPVI